MLWPLPSKLTFEANRAELACSAHYSAGFAMP